MELDINKNILAIITRSPLNMSFSYIINYPKLLHDFEALIIITTKDCRQNIDDQQEELTCIETPKGRLPISESLLYAI